MTLTKNVSDIQTLLPKRIAIKVWLRALQSTISSPAKEWETEIAIQKIGNIPHVFLYSIYDFSNITALKVSSL